MLEICVNEKYVGVKNIMQIFDFEFIDFRLTNCVGHCVLSKSSPGRSFSGLGSMPPLAEVINQLINWLFSFKRLFAN